MSSFDTARDLRLPGVVVERAYFDTTAWSPRLRNMVKRALRFGYIEGGWNSKAKQIALKLAECHGLQVIDASHYGFRVPLPSKYADDTARRLIELIDAQEALDLMMATSEHMKDHIRSRTYLNRQTIESAHTHNRWLAMYSPELRKQACEVLAATRTGRMLEQVETMCKRLDDGEPIDITLSL